MQNVLSAPFLGQLDQHLSVLQREGLIPLWHGHRVAAGSLRQEARDRHLHTAALIVLLVSSDVLASATRYHDMHQALQRRERNEAQVLPVLLRACDWQSTPLAALPWRCCRREPGR